MANFFITVKTKFLSLDILMFMFAAPTCHFSTAGFNHFYQSFQFEQYVNTPTHNKRHTIDLVLSYGVSLNNIDPLDFSVSDHKTVIFHALLLQPAQKSAYLIHSHIYNSSSASIFFHRKALTQWISYWIISTANVAKFLMTLPL